MGLTIEQYPVYGGASTVNAYLNIRDIRHNKNDDLFSLNGFAKITTGDVFIKAIHIEIKSKTIFTNSWDALYIELKRILVVDGIVFIDA
tara:strand:- start:486 stop:752 length:267 start_codon:yes stop_codon:yes gene_type:complete